MSIPGHRLLDLARAGAGAAWVRVERVRGSAPREPGAAMLVTATATEGTIGGGHLEFEAIAAARRMLAGTARALERRFVLGASLGQCCGGEVSLSLRRIDARETPWLEALAALDEAGGTLVLATDPDADPGAPHTRVRGADAVPAAAIGPRAAPGRPSPDAAPPLVSTVAVRPWPVWVFGAGHVGEAVVRVLATLPARIAWVDPREHAFPATLPPNVRAIASDSPAHEVAAIPPGADVLVMTHSHALDLDLCAALLARDDLAGVGLIGSRTKAARFRARLAQRGVPPARLARLRCPIGTLPGAADGAPDGAPDYADPAAARLAEAPCDAPARAARDAHAQAPRDAPARAPRDALDRHPGAIAVAVAFELWAARRTVAHPAGVAR
jgi:xanthine dehydrogenase accessory factor